MRTLLALAAGLVAGLVAGYLVRPLAGTPVLRPGAEVSFRQPNGLLAFTGQVVSVEARYGSPTTITLQDRGAVMRPLKIGRNT